MKQVTAYRCEHCRKIYLREYACREHEQNRCTQNPEIRPLCYSCKHYEPSWEDDEREEIEYEVWCDPYCGEHYSTKLFNPNKCTHESNECKLYNNMKLSDAMQTALAEENYQPMPNRRNGGCKFYSAIPNHPYSEK